MCTIIIKVWSRSDIKTPFLEYNVCMYVCAPATWWSGAPPHFSSSSVCIFPFLALHQLCWRVALCLFKKKVYTAPPPPHYLCVVHHVHDVRRRKVRAGAPRAAPDIIINLWNCYNNLIFLRFAREPSLTWCTISIFFSCAKKCYFSCHIFFVVVVVLV